MPGASTLGLVRLFGISELTQAGLFEWIRKVGRSYAVTENFGESAAARTSVWRRKIVVDVILTRRGEEEKPVLFNLGTGVRWVAGQFCECRI